MRFGTAILAIVTLPQLTLAASPVLDPVADVAVDPETLAPITFSLRATDIDVGDSVAFALVDAETGRLSPLTAFLTARPAEGARFRSDFRWTPSVHEAGRYELRAVARDAEGHEDTTVFTLTVLAASTDATIEAIHGATVVPFNDADNPDAYAYEIVAHSALGLPLEYGMRILERSPENPPAIVLPFQQEPTFALTFEAAARYSLRPEVRTAWSARPASGAGLEVYAYDPDSGLVPSSGRPEVTTTGPARFAVTWPPDPHDRVATYRVRPYLGFSPGPVSWVDVPENPADEPSTYSLEYDFADPARADLRTLIASANALLPAIPSTRFVVIVDAVPRDGEEPQLLFTGALASVDFAAALPHVEHIEIDTQADRTVAVTLGPVVNPGGQFAPAEVRLYWNAYDPAGEVQVLPAEPGAGTVLSVDGRPLLAGEAQGTLLVSVVDSTLVPGEAFETLVGSHAVQLDPPLCRDGLDNDGDGWVDLAGGDPGCGGPEDDDEYDRVDGFGGRRRALIVYNTNTADGARIAEHYRAARDLDEQTLCPVPLPPGSVASAEELLGARKVIVESCLCGNVLGRSIAACDGVAPSSLAAASPVTHLVLIKGVPERLADTGWPSDGQEPPLGYYLSWLVHHDDSIFGEGTVGLYEIHGYDGLAPDSIDHQTSDAVAGSPRPLSPGLDAMLAYGHVAALDTERTLELIDRTLAAEAMGFQGSLLSQGDEATLDFLRGLAGGLADPECTAYLDDPGGVWPHEACRAGATASGLVPGEVARDGLEQRIPFAVDAGLYLGSGLVPGHAAFNTFDTLLAWRRTHPDEQPTPCIPLCADHPTPKDRSTCRNLSSDVFREIDTRCVGVADGFLGWQLRSWPVQYYGFPPPGFGLDADGAREKTIPYPRQGSPFGNGYVHFGALDAVDEPTCLDAEGVAAPCPERIHVSLTADAAFEPAAVRLETAVRLQLRRGGGSRGRLVVGVDYRRADGAVFPVERAIDLTAPRPLWTEEGVVLAAPVEAAPVAGARLRLASRREDDLRGWLDLDAIRWFDTADPFETNLLPEDAAGFERPYLGPTQPGDWAAHVIDRLGGIAWWGSSSHHATGGLAYREPTRFAGAFFAGRTLGEALLYTGRNARSGIVYGDPLYRPSGARIYVDDGGVDGAGRHVIVGDALPQPGTATPALYVDAFHGQARRDVTEWSVEACRAETVETCDATAAWVGVEASMDRGVQAVLGHRLAVAPVDLFDATAPDEDQDVTLRLRVWNPADEADAGTPAGARSDLTAYARIHHDAVGNHPPVAREVRIEPARPEPEERLFVVYAFADEEGHVEDLGGRRIAWLADGLEQPDLAGAMTVPAARTTEGQHWQVEVRVSDGFALGPPARSGPVTIGCGPPPLPVVLTGVERAAGGGVVLTVDDPNPVGQATGYHVYAGVDPAVLPRDVEHATDADPARPGVQIDAAAEGALTFYRVRAVDARCAAEGP